jgi:hypothetical protein
MMSRTQVTLESELHRRARAKAAALGISLAEYMRQLVAADLEGPRRAADVRAVFDLGRSAGSDVARDKDRYLGDAVAAGAEEGRTGTAMAARRTPRR